jgi:para-nitrobenzyl esterase
LEIAPRLGDTERGRDIASAAAGHPEEVTAVAAEPTPNLAEIQRDRRRRAPCGSRRSCCSKVVKNNWDADIGRRGAAGKDWLPPQHSQFVRESAIGAEDVVMSRPFHASRVLVALAVAGATACASLEDIGSDRASETGPGDGRAAGAIVVQTTGGLVRGVIEGDVRAFRGIPYAAPPVGNLRWHAPRPPAPWTGVRDTFTFAPICDPRGKPGPAGFSEDCLYLNIYTQVARAHRQPVVVYLHGNGATAVSPTGRIPTGPPRLATRGAVVVTVDWRGWTLIGTLDSPQLAAEDDGAGNFSTLDLIAALKWVRDNAEAFGGDPDRVLITGLSGGADSVLHLMATPLAAGLFAAAMVESPGWTDVQTRTIAEQGGIDLALALGCDSDPDPLVCLRAASAHDIVAAGHAPLVNQSVIDGRVFSGSLFDVLASQHNVPLLIGSSAQEDGNLEPGPLPVTEADYEADLGASYGANLVPAILDVYPASAYPAPAAALIDVDTDAGITCPMRRFAIAVLGGASEHESPKVWRWLFTHIFENNADLAALGAFHGELTYFELGDFGAVQGVAYAPTAAELELSQRLMDTVVRFAKTHNPNGSALTRRWPRYDTDHERLLVIDEAVRHDARYHVAQCEFWDSL